jgi:hypothetical protein
MQNSDAILHPQKDGGKAFADNNRMFNEMIDFIRQSKQRSAEINAARNIVKGLSDRGISIPDSVLSDLDAASLPLNNPKHKSIDFNKFDSYTRYKPWGVQDDASLANQVSKYGGGKNNEVYSEPIIDKTNGTVKYHVTKKLTDDEQNSIANSGAALYGSNLGFRTMIDNLSKSQFAHNLDGLFQKHFNRPITSEQDLAAAYALSKNPNMTEYDTKPSPISGWSQQAFNQKGQLAGITATARGGAQAKVDADKENKAFLESVTPLRNAWDNVTDPNSSIKPVELDQAAYKNLGQDRFGRQFNATAELQNKYKQTFKTADGKNESIVPVFHVPLADPNNAYILYRGHPEAVQKVSKDLLEQEQYNTLKKGAPLNQQATTKPASTIPKTTPTKIEDLRKKYGY